MFLLLVMISDDSNFTIQSSVDQTMLTIGSVIPTDSGDYTCRMRGDNNAELSGVVRLLMIDILPSAVTTRFTTGSKYNNHYLKVVQQHLTSVC